jgi:hypothetical protein
LAGLNAVNFSTKPSRSAVEAILSEYIWFWDQTVPDESLYWQEQGQLSFRFNLSVLIKWMK